MTSYGSRGAANRFSAQRSRVQVRGLFFVPSQAVDAVAAFAMSGYQVRSRGYGRDEAKPWGHVASLAMSTFQKRRRKRPTK